jgi:archaellum component FlaC
VTENVENLILERLRRMDERLGNIEGDLHDVKTRMTAVEEHVGGLFIGISGVNNRMDRLNDRLERIERRLDLSDAR